MLSASDRHVERVIRRTIWVAGLSGQDSADQERIAVRTLRCLRPEMMASEALSMVRHIRLGLAETAARPRADEASPPAARPA